MEKNNHPGALGASRNKQQTVLGVFANIFAPYTHTIFQGVKLCGFSSGARMTGSQSPASCRKHILLIIIEL